MLMPHESVHQSVTVFFNDAQYREAKRNREYLTYITPKAQ